MTIAENIRKFRRERGMTQKQLGEKCGMYESQIRKYELGTANPKIDTIKKIADVLNISIDRLTGDSVSCIIENRLKEIDKTLKQVAREADVPLYWLQHLDTFIPGELGDYEIGYDWITRVAEVLGLPGSTLRTALARQEIPISDDLLRVTAEEAFGGINTYSSPCIVNSTEKMRETPLTSRDQRDIAKDVDRIMEKLSLGEDGPASFNGETLSPESMELFKEELQIALKRLKLINKERYNPHKNKK